jgi:DNA sulfur modification protein DndB
MPDKIYTFYVYFQIEKIHFQRWGSMDAHSFIFPAVCGVQAGQQYYIAMCPLRLVPKILLFNEDEVPAEMRAQRVLNKARVPEIAAYMVKNKTEYAFSSLTASIDGTVQFKPWDTSDGGRDIGHLVVPLTARMVINDGQHRRAAIEEALKECPELADESISVVFFVDRGLKRSQQLFADLNQHAVRPTRSLGILYNHRDPMAELAKALAEQVPIFHGLTEVEKTTISNRSTKLFTLSSIHQATQALLNLTPKRNKPTRKESQLALDYWTVLGNVIPEWRMASARELSCAELRANYVHSHGVILHALGIAGSTLINHYPDKWADRLKPLAKVDWRRSNSKLWEGRAMLGGKMSKAHMNVTLTAILLKKLLALPLTPEETKVEQQRRD